MKVNKQHRILNSIFDSLTSKHKQLASCETACCGRRPNPPIEVRLLFLGNLVCQGFHYTTKRIWRLVTTQPTVLSLFFWHHLRFGVLRESSVRRRARISRSSHLSAAPLPYLLQSEHHQPHRL